MLGRSMIDKVNGIIEILDLGATDRKSISDTLGISLSCVGTVVSEMRSLGIIGEYTKKDTSSLGRGAVNLFLKNDPVFAVCRIYPNKFSTVIFGYNLKITDTVNQTITDPLFLDDCLISYLRLLKQKYPKLRHICVTADAKCDKDTFRNCSVRGLDGLPIKDIISEFFPNTDVSIDNTSLWIPDHTDGMNAVISEYGGTLSLTLVHNGDVISNQSIHIGDTPDKDGRIINSKIRFAAYSHDYISVISSFIDSLLTLISVNRIYLSLERYTSADTVFNEISSYLILGQIHSYAELPEFISVDSETIASERLRRSIRSRNIHSMFES